MTRIRNYDLGVMFRRELAPELLPDFAQRAEAAGFDELWVVEDCFYASGVAAAAVALAGTDAMRVGLGIMPAVARNPAFAAMEIATLARIFPGRFLPGFGHGVAGWMRQIGAFPPSQLRALEEVTATVRRLLAGERVTFEGQHVRIADAELVHPVAVVPPVSLGVRGPKSLALSGRVADGTILAEYASPAYMMWAREQIARGAQAAGREAEPHRLTVFTWAAAEAARPRLRAMAADALASGNLDAQLALLGIMPDVEALREAGGRDRLEAGMPDAWLDELAVVGDFEARERGIRRLVEAGAQTVVLVPLPGQGVEALDPLAEHCRPR